jgi:secondary thiamine-phosphate synthase enzyme
MQVKVTTTDITVAAQRRMAWIDLTDDLRRAVKDSGVVDGCAIVYCAHTTCAVLINENESGALEDVQRRLDALIPAGAYYAHDDFMRRTENLIEGERINGQAHVIQMLLSATSQSIPVRGGEALLGQWQRVLLWELDEPKPRTIHLQVWGITEAPRTTGS